MKHLRPLLLLALALMPLLLPLPAHAARLALVIGNRDYTVGALVNPINDANAVSAALGALGFQVTPVKNLKRDDIGRTVESFVSRIRAGDDVVVFYAGHGLQVKGVNYLPAVDANIRVESDVALNSLNLNQLLDKLDEAKSGVRLLLIDACRDNPYSRGFRSGARGLARVEGAPSGTLMHFATRPGGVAADGTGGNGLYTTELLKHLKTPGLAVESMLKRVAAGVRQASGGDQQPWTEGALDGEFYFAQGVIAPVPVISAVQVTGTRQEPSPQVIPQPQPVRPAPATLAAGQTFKDCADCPELVVIPAGSFHKGSNDNDSEKPIHNVSLKSFALGKYEVTQGQWKAVMGNNPSMFSSCGDNCPVENVSWDDIQQYIQKLSATSGQQYRLPSESEWEYAARAGTNTKYPWGDGIGKNNANCDGCGSQWDNKTAAPVGQFRANAFGLHDMHGNVWEWVQDCFHRNNIGAPSDGSAWTSSCIANIRVLRGGSWSIDPAYLRSAFRFGHNQDGGEGRTGFRLARTLLTP